MSGHPKSSLGSSVTVELEAVVMRLVGAVLLEIHDEWHVADRRDVSEGAMALLDGEADRVGPANAFLLASRRGYPEMTRRKTGPRARDQLTASP